MKCPIRIANLLAKVVIGIGMIMALQGCPLLVVGAIGGGALVATDRRTIGTQTEDRGIQLKALAQLESELPRSSHVDITVFNRRALLTGEVPTAAAREQAERITQGVTNVEQVYNQLALLPASSFIQRSQDVYLEGRVKAALIGEKGISANYFKVVSERKHIYLMGLVTHEEGARGAAAARRVPNVKEVITLYQYVTPEEARKLSFGGDVSAVQRNAPAPPRNQH